MAPTLQRNTRAVTRSDTKIIPEAAVKSKTTVGLESQPKHGCVTPELVKALNHMALGFTLAYDRKIIKDFFRYHRYQLGQDFGFEATEL